MNEGVKLHYFLKAYVSSQLGYISNFFSQLSLISYSGQSINNKIEEGCFANVGGMIKFMTIFSIIPHSVIRLNISYTSYTMTNYGFGLSNIE